MRALGPSASRRTARTWSPRVTCPLWIGTGFGSKKGVIRFWRVSDGTLRQMYDARTGLAVTSPIAWSPDATRFAYGTYEGAGVVARTPLTIQLSPVLAGIKMRADGNVLVRQSGTPGTEYHVETTT